METGGYIICYINIFVCIYNVCIYIDLFIHCIFYANQFNLIIYNVL